MRRTNEDSHLARPPLFVVADGMGGSRAGEVASQLAVDVRGAGRTAGPAEELLRSAIARGQPPASTSAAERRPGRRPAWAPRSRPRWWRTRPSRSGTSATRAPTCGATASLQQVSDDHSLVGELVRRGALTPEEAERHPQRTSSRARSAPRPRRRRHVDARGGARRRLPARLGRPHQHDPGRRDRVDPDRRALARARRARAGARRQRGRWRRQRHGHRFRVGRVPREE